MDPRRRAPAWAGIDDDYRPATLAPAYVGRILILLNSLVHYAQSEEFSPVIDEAQTQVPLQQSCAIAWRASDSETPAEIEPVVRWK
jgi:hypothetical protein